MTAILEGREYLLTHIYIFLDRKNKNYFNCQVTYTCLMYLFLTEMMSCSSIQCSHPWNLLMPLAASFTCVCPNSGSLPPDKLFCCLQRFSLGPHAVQKAAQKCFLFPSSKLVQIDYKILVRFRGKAWFVGCGLLLFYSECDFYSILPL